MITFEGFPFGLKTERLRDEFLSPNIDPRLRAVMLETAFYVRQRYGGCIIEWTEIFRTDEEQRAIYPNGPMVVSVHQVWRGADGVVRALGADEHRYIQAWINKRFPYGNPKYQTCKYHDVGLGLHLHLQVIDLAFLKRRLGYAS